MLAHFPQHAFTVLSESACKDPDQKRNVPSARRVRALPQLKEELAAREAKRTGLKATLQRRLHGLLVQAAIQASGEEAESDVDDEGGAARTAAAARPRAEGACTEVLRCLVFSEWVTAGAKGRGGFHTCPLSECFHTKVQSRRCFHLGRPSGSTAEAHRTQ